MTFLVQLRLLECSTAADDSRPSGADVSIRLQTLSKSITIRPSQTICARMIKSLGLTFEMAEDGQEALDKMLDQKREYSCVLSDIQVRTAVLCP